MRPTDSPGRVGSRGQGGYSTAPAGQFTPPANTVVPVIDNTSPTVGAVLSVTTGTWTGAPASFTYAYQWQRGTTNLGGATSSSYTVVIGDLGFTLRCRVTAANGVAPNGIVFTADTSAVTLVYATWNPSDKGSANILSNGDLTSTVPDLNGGVRSTIGKSTGKWYWEIHLDSAISAAYAQVAIKTGATDVNYASASAQEVAYVVALAKKIINFSQIVYGAAGAVGDYIGVALDMDAGEVTYYKNGTSQGVAQTGLTGTHFAGVSSFVQDQVVTANFGATAFTYAPPSGFNAGLY